MQLIHNRLLAAPFPGDQIMQWEGWMLRETACRW